MQARFVLVLLVQLVNNCKSVIYLAASKVFYEFKLS